jgi:hypothetical protein
MLTVLAAGRDCLGSRRSDNAAWALAVPDPPLAIRRRKRRAGACTQITSCALLPSHSQLSPYVSELSLYDIAGTPGVAADVSHINSKARVKVCGCSLFLNGPAAFTGLLLSPERCSCDCHVLS